jgi:pimeloyl-ACP methyl ester carboxylesterase
MALMTADARPHGSRWMAGAGPGLSAAAVGWVVRHRCSPAVRRWRPGGGVHRIAGELSVRTTGDGDRAVILLHGLTASGDYFGAEYDRLADHAQLVIPDLLGFGRSLDPRRSDHSLEAHLAALDLMARELRLDGRELTVVGHSLGALLALHWAARRLDVRHVVCFSTPLYVDAQEADERIAAMGRIERLFAPQGPAARALCGWMCRHRAIAQWIAVAVEPRWPVAITRMAVRHSWASYTGAMNSVIRHGGWETPLRALEAAGVPVLLADGAVDPVPVRERAAGVAGRHRNVTAAAHATAGHQLPITHPTWCVNLVAARGGLDRDAARAASRPQDEIGA